MLICIAMRSFLAGFLRLLHEVEFLQGKYNRLQQALSALDGLEHHMAVAAAVIRAIRDRLPASDVLSLFVALDDALVLPTAPADAGTLSSGDDDIDNLVEFVRRAWERPSA